MALAIATNNAALNAAASASSVNREMETSMARLSSGKRINSASDDAAGVAISSRLSAEIRGTDQSIRNALDGQALIDTAEGAHKEIENILQRMREISVQAANDTNNDQDRMNLQAEMDALITEIDRIAGTTTWAGEKLMESETGSFFSFQVGAATGEKNQIDVTIDGMGANILGFSTTVPSADPVSSTPSLNPSLDPATTVAAELLQGKAISAAGEVVLNNGLEKATMIITHKTASPATTHNVNIDLTSAESINQSVADINATLVASAGYAAGDITGATPVIQARVSTTPGNEGVIEFAGSAVAGITFANDEINTVANASIDASGHVTFADGATSAVLTFTDSSTPAGPKTLTIDPADLDAFITAQAASTGTDVNGLKAEIVAVDDGDGGVTSVLKLTQVTGTNRYDITTLTSDRTANQIADPASSAPAASASPAAPAGDAPRTSVANDDDARVTIVAIDAAIQKVNIQRSSLGAVSNRLSHTVNNLTNISSNLSAAQGGIEDADFAHETTMLAKNQILQQASTAMLAQANASKQNVLSLLQG
jgi:flagellin